MFILMTSLQEYCNHKTALSFFYLYVVVVENAPLYGLRIFSIVS